MQITRYVYDIIQTCWNRPCHTSVEFRAETPFFGINVNIVTVVAGITFQWSDVDGSFVLDENMEDFDLSGMVVNCSPNDLMIDNESADEKAEEALDNMEMTYDELQLSLLEGELF